MAGDMRKSGGRGDRVQTTEEAPFRAIRFGSPEDLGMEAVEVAVQAWPTKSLTRRLADALEKAAHQSSD